MKQLLSSHIRPLALTIAAFSFAHSSVAEDAEIPSTETDIEFGLLTTTGNTETTSFKGKIDFQQELTRFRNRIILEGLLKEDQIEENQNNETVKVKRTTAEKYFLSGQSDLKLNSKHRGLFIFGSYEEDKFSGYAYQSTVAIGYSDRMFGTERSHLDFNIGPGISHTKTDDERDEQGNVITEGDKATAGVIRFAMDFRFDISENAKFTQTFSSDIAAEQGKNTKTKAVSAISANMTNALALKASFTIDQNTHVAPDKKHADTQTAITFVYSL